MSLWPFKAFLILIVISVIQLSLASQQFSFSSAPFLFDSELQHQIYVYFKNQEHFISFVL